MNDIKLMKLLKTFGSFGFGFFWGVTELLHSNPKSNREEIVEYLNIKYFGSIDKLDTCLDECIKIDLFYIDDNNYLCSNRVNRNIADMNYYKEVKSKGGKVGMKNRWAKNSETSNIENIDKSEENNSTAENFFNDNSIAIINKTTLEKEKSKNEFDNDEFILDDIEDFCISADGISIIDDYKYSPISK